MADSHFKQRLDRATGPTDARRMLDALANGASTDLLTEGAINKFFTDERAQDALAAAFAAGVKTGITITYNDGSNSFDFNVPLASYALQSYVDAAVAGLSWKQAVRAATTANGTLSTAFANGQTIDGVTLATGDRILVKNQSTASQNGIYLVAASGAPTRTTDADAGTELVNASVYVSEGSTLADTQWTCSTNAPITIGSTSIAWAQLTAGGGITALTSDVTASGSGSVAATIANDAVTYAKMQNVSATSRILGRKTASAGDPEECTLSDVLDFIGSAAQGDILYRGASGWARLGAGTSGQVLKTLGAAANPLWASVAGVSGGGVDFIGRATVSGAAATTLTLSGLDLGTDQVYLIYPSLKNATASLAVISGFFNGDTVATNYDTDNYQSSGATFGSARSNAATIAVLNASSTLMGQIAVSNDLDSKPTAIWRQRTGSTTTIELREGVTMWRTAANVTSITLSSSVASALAIGSYFDVYRIAH